MPKKRVLVIEDEPAIGEAICDCLLMAGYDVDVFTDVDLALACFAEVHHGLVVTDIVMPKREGFELLREIKQQAPEVGVVAISGGGRFVPGGSLLELAERLGADATLAKPFRLAELVRLVEELDRRLDLAALRPQTIATEAVP